MAGKRIVIFANPIAGRGRGQGIARRLEGRLRADGHEVLYAQRRPDLLSPDDLPPEVDAAIIIGGDGTLRSVADRLCGACQASAGEGASPTASSPARPVTASPAHLTGPPLLVVPLGTANLMGRHLGISWSKDTLEDQVSAAIARGRVVSLDAGRANGKLFLLMVGVGFDAAVVHALERIRTGPITMASYALPAALALGAYQYPALRVTVDGREVFGTAPAVAWVGNVPEYGTGFPILSHARPDDGLLDVCVLPCAGPVELARYALQAIAGEHVMQEGVVYVKGRHVRIESPGAGPAGVPVQVDGDAAGHTPVEIDLLPVRLPFIVP